MVEAEEGGSVVRREWRVVREVKVMVKCVKKDANEERKWMARVKRYVTVSRKKKKLKGEKKQKQKQTHKSSTEIK